MAYNTSFPTTPQNGVPFDLAEMNLLGESGTRREAAVSRACPAVRIAQARNVQEGMFPCPRGQKASKQGHSGSKQGELERAATGEALVLAPSLSRKQREGNESSILSHWHPSLKCADKGRSQVLGLLWKPGEKREMGWERQEADSHAPEARKEGTLDVERVADLPFTEAWWGHSGLANDSAGRALRSLHWPERECCSQGAGAAGWGRFLVLGTHLQKSQVFLRPGKSA